MLEGSDPLRAPRTRRGWEGRTVAFALRCAALSLGLAFVVVCSSGSLTLGRDAAIAAARAAVPERETITRVISAKTGQFSDFDNHATDAISPPNRKVWAVAFAGSFSGSCGPARPTADAHSTCPPPATTMLVIIDERNGAFIEGMTPAHAPR